MSGVSISIPCSSNPPAINRFSVFGGTMVVLGVILTKLRGQAGMENMVWSPVVSPFSPDNPGSFSFVDNIPFTATMLPITAYLSQAIPGAENNVLWWALALGACYGGNGTIIGASANVVAMGIAEAAGYPIRFFDFMKVGFVYMVISLVLANIWLLIFY